jgi:hypothetical protein
MFDIIFYSDAALSAFIAAAQHGIDEHTPPTRCEELWMQQSYTAIRDSAARAVGLRFPVMVDFSEDDRYCIVDLINFNLEPLLAYAEGLDLRAVHGFAFD